MMEFKISQDEAGRRLDVVVAAKLGWSRNAAAIAIKNGQVTLNEVPAKPSSLAEAGQMVAVNEASQNAAPLPIDLPVVYEDADLMVIDKPAGILVHPGSGRLKEFTVADFVRPLVTDSDQNRPGIVHRLDRLTSGLLVVAKHPESKAYLQKLFRDRHIHKTYTALVTGHPSPPAATIDLPLDRSAATRTRRAVSALGRPSVTVYKTLRDFSGYALLEANPHTGRTHQIRAHFAAIGHPVAGDRPYGAPVGPPGLNRQFLHAAKLEFTGPGGQNIRLESPLPADLQLVLNQLEKGVY